MKRRILSAVLAVLMILTMMPAAMATDDANAQMAKAYLSVIESREDFIGIEDEYNPGYYSEGEGLAYTGLMDFDGDGTVELYLIDVEKDWENNWYTLSEELWYWDGSSAQRAYQREHISTGAHISGSCKVYILEKDGKTYLANVYDEMHSGICYSTLRIFEYKSGALVQAKEIEEVWSTYGPESDFYYALSVDGVEIERTPLTVELGESSAKAKQLRAEYPLEEYNLVIDGGAWITLSWRANKVGKLVANLERNISNFYASAGYDDMQIYLDVIEHSPDASSYLVDFDGDGSKELLIWDEEDYSVKYEVWKGNERVVSSKIPFLLNEDYSYCSIASSKEYPGKLFLRYYGCMRQDSQSYKTETITDGVWVTVDTADWYEDYSDGMAGDVPDCYVNNATFPPVYTYYQDFCVLCDAMNGKYTDIYRLGGYHSAKSDIQTEQNNKKIPSDWAKAEIDKAEAAGLIPELTGKPGWRDNSKRLHFAQMVVQLVETVLDEKLVAAPTNTFADCADASVLKAYKAGIINGVGDGKFAPNDGLSREQLATMLWRATEYIQKRSGKTTLKNGGSIDGYADRESVSDYAVEAVTTLSENGIMKGTSETMLSPQDGCTIEQSVLLAYRLYEKIK